MAKLTRTQKYADFRDSLSRDKESALTTQELSKYEDRLNNVTQTLNPTPAPEVKPVTPVTPVAPVSEPVNEYHWTEFQETPVKVDNTPKVNDEAIKQIIEEPIVKPIIEESQINHIGGNETKEDVAEFDEPILSSNYLDYFTSNPDIEKAYADIEKDVNNAMNEISSIDSQKVEAKPAEPVFEKVEEVKPVETVVTPVNEEKVDQIVENHEFNTNIIDEAINEVGEYNRINGVQSISEITNEMVNEIRHPGVVKEEEEKVVKPVEEVKPVVEEKPVDIPFQNNFNSAPLNPVDLNDDDFSNTVSMEITKIMDEIASVEAVESKPEPVVQNVETVEEHPVLTKVLEEEPVEEVVEIKNLKDIETDPVKDTTSGTIPFVVAAGDDEDVIEEDEEDGSNTILNVILIVLIVVLVAVLGLIIFYILKTRGII